MTFQLIPHDTYVLLTKIKEDIRYIDEMNLTLIEKIQSLRNTEKYETKENIND